MENIRDFKKELFFKTSSTSKKIFIINHKDKLKKEAQNAALKILEEPPANIIILLISPNENLLLPTIISRCEIVRLQSKNPSGLQPNPSKLSDLDLGERLSLAEKLSTKENKEESLEDLRKRAEEWLSCVINDAKTKINLEILKSALYAKEQIKKNLNIRLVLENFLINQ